MLARFPIRSWSAVHVVDLRDQSYWTMYMSENIYIRGNTLLKRRCRWNF